MKVCLRLSLVSFHRSEEEDAEIGRSCGRTLGHGMMVTSWAGVSERKILSASMKALQMAKQVASIFRRIVRVPR